MRRMKKDPGVGLVHALKPAAVRLYKPLIVVPTGDKNFWFSHFRRILAAETVERSYLISLATPVFSYSIQQIINNK